MIERFSILCTQKRMTLEDYRKNLRGVNDGSDFPEEFLVRLHCSSVYLVGD